MSQIAYTAGRLSSLTAEGETLLSSVTGKVMKICTAELRKENRRDRKQAKKPKNP